MHADSVRHLEIKIRGINRKLTRIEGGAWEKRFLFYLTVKKDVRIIKE